MVAAKYWCAVRWSKLKVRRCRKKLISKLDPRPAAEDDVDLKSRIESKLDQVYVILDEAFRPKSGIQSKTYFKSTGY